MSTIEECSDGSLNKFFNRDYKSSRIDSDDTIDVTGVSCSSIMSRENLNKKNKGKNRREFDLKKKFILQLIRVLEFLF